MSAAFDGLCGRLRCGADVEDRSRSIANCNCKIEREVPLRDVTLLSVIKGRLPHIISLSLPPSPIAMGTAESSRKSEGPHGSGRKLLGRCVRHGNRSLIGLPTKQIGLARKVPQHRNAHLLHRCRRPTMTRCTRRCGWAPRPTYPISGFCSSLAGTASSA